MINKMLLDFTVFTILVLVIVISNGLFMANTIKQIKKIVIWCLCVGYLIIIVLYVKNPTREPLLSFLKDVAVVLFK